VRWRNSELQPRRDASDTGAGYFAPDMSQYTLYYTPHACSLTPHVVLRELNVPFDLVQVDLRTKKLVDPAAGDWLTINPKGYVPALRLGDGRVVTEIPVILSYLADTHADAGLAPARGTAERLELDMRLAFIATELHKGFGVFFNPIATDEIKAAAKQRLAQRITELAAGLRGTQFLGGDRFSIADAYALYVLRCWKMVAQGDLSIVPELPAYYQRLVERPSVAKALEVEGLTA
jgi:glutathione S-transferase